MAKPTSRDWCGRTVELQEGCKTTRISNDNGKEQRGDPARSMLSRVAPLAGKKWEIEQTKPLRGF